MSESREVLERVFREESGVVMGALLAQLHDLDLAEDAFQDAIAAALERWPADGVPRRPGAWLLTAARRKALDRLRRKATRLDKQSALELEAELTQPPETWLEDDEAIPDERLRLIFTCCHPALARQAQVALTLRTLGGLSTRRSRARSWSTRRRWRGGWCAPRRSCATRRSRTGCPTRSSCPSGSSRCWPCST